MSIFPVSAIPSASSEILVIDNSLRFNDDDSAYLSTSMSGTGGRTTFTYSGWVKLGNIGVAFDLLAAPYSSSQNGSFLQITSSGYFYSQTRNYSTGSQGAFDGDCTSDMIFRDPTAWYHIVFAYDSTLATAVDRQKLYVNGDLQTFSAQDTVTQNNTQYLGSEYTSLIGRGYGTTGNIDGYLAEVNFIDGQALTPSSFGQSGDYGEWNAIEYKGTYGTNGFYLDFSGSAPITAHGDTHHSTTKSKFGSSSLYFDGNGDYLSLSNRPEWNFGTGNFTQEMWVYPTSLPSSGYTKLMWTSVQLALYANGSLYVWAGGEGGSATGVVSTGSWQHIALVKNSGVLKVYVDGSEVLSFNSGGISDHGERFFFALSGDYYTGYAEEIRISDTARYTSAFTPPSAPFTTDSNTLTLIQSEDVNGSLIPTLGSDQSGNTNNWTSENLSVNDQMIDTPTNNFPTLNFLDKSGVTLSEGNLKQVQGAGYAGVRASMAFPSSGKWYVEYVENSTAGSNVIGTFSPKGGSYNLGSNGGNQFVYWGSNGSLWTSGASNWQSSLPIGSGGVLQMAYDSDTGKTWIGYNNVWRRGSAGSVLTDGNPSAGTNPTGTWADYAEDTFCTIFSYNLNGVMNFGQDSSFAGNKTAQGNQDSNEIGDFYYTPPTGFLALCTANLPDPTVIPSEHFNTVAYAGTGSAGLAITGVGFQPDFTWLKRRSLASNHHLYNSISGAGKFLQSSTDTAESTTADGLDSFDADGFTLDATDATNPAENSSGHTFVSWNWKAGGTAVSNTNGSITSSVSANTAAGFSVVSYTGTGSVGTVGHGLSQPLDMIIVKNLSVTNYWPVWNRTVSSGNGKYLYLNATNGTSGPAGVPIWDATDTTTQSSFSTFDIGANSLVSGSGNAQIAYCFHSVDGYSKVSSYSGNGSADGPFIHTGFRPAYVMIKRTDSGNTYTSWMILDSERQDYNPTDHTKNLWANKDFPEGKRGNGASSGTYLEVDFTSNGFKIRGVSNHETNVSNGKYIYIAFAESPFKHTNAR